MMIMTGSSRRLNSTRLHSQGSYSIATSLPASRVKQACGACRVPTFPPSPSASALLPNASRRKRRRRGNCTWSQISTLSLSLSLTLTLSGQTRGVMLPNGKYMDRCLLMRLMLLIHWGSNLHRANRFVIGWELLPLNCWWPRKCQCQC